METTLYKIHLTNGKTLYIGVHGEEGERVLLEDFKELDKDGFFEWECDGDEVLFIPVRNIMYIQAINMD